jgi:glycosyltransferase involved in cell wall biosynthesis
MNFIFFSRLTREKGFNLIVDAFARIIDEQGKIPGNLFIFSE